MWGIITGLIVVLLLILDLRINPEDYNRSDNEPPWL
jgi:hypothetical protein